MKNISLKNRTLTQLIDYHEAQHRLSRSEILEERTGGASSSLAPQDVNVATNFQNIATPFEERSGDIV